MTEPKLSTTQMEQLVSYIPPTLEDHKRLYFLAKGTGQLSPAEKFYQYLSLNGFEYGDRALGVVRNDSLSGQIANLNSANIAMAKTGVDISYESEKALKIQYDLMVGHYSEEIIQIALYPLLLSFEHKF